MTQALAPSPAPEPFEGSQMGLLGHLSELRDRMIWIVAALSIGTVISFVFVTPLLQFITAPVGTKLQALGPTDTIGIFFRVGFASGAVFAMPVMVYQIVAFIAPGLYPHEKRTLLIIMPGIMLLFFTGAVFAYFIMLPVAVGFLQNFLGTVINQEWTIDRYIGFVTRIVFWIGVFFETPLVIAFMARIGLISGPQLLSYWRQAIVIVSVVAAMITPTVDPVNMAIVMLPLILLFFMGVGLAYILYKPRAPRSPDEMDWGGDDE